jgi:hypothetical protein
VATIILGAIFVLLIQLGVPNFSTVRVEWVEPLKTLRHLRPRSVTGVEKAQVKLWLHVAGG